ncbi:amidohydrolase family protein [Microbacterium excoecariae]|uniref:amidohydrolase family protein n=1 Tax=Microbacterium excoecariae TaxID=2715210 RepID=UPI00140D523E|nr:amidohydrolase family protein [Microbacterium excoecariae]NHI17895.1 amidohydrolase family protein [Microbacterium excoecariae]
MDVSSPRRLRGATLADGRVVDVVLDGETVGAVTEAAAGAPLEDGDLDLGGFLLLAAPADPHTHLDKALSWDAIRPVSGDLETAIASWTDFIRGTTEDEIRGRAVRAIERYVANGTTALRTHVDVPSEGDPARGVRAVAAARAQFAGIVDIEIVALAARDIDPARVEAALAAGADLVGGAPHLATDEGADLARLLDVAERHGVGVDIHADEALRHGDTLRLMSRRTADWTVTRTASHCVRLSMMTADELDPLLAEVAAAGIGVVANPLTNLYLQGWDDPVAMPRGVAPVGRLRRAGVTTAAGGDNMRDPFNPVGRADAFETAMLLVATTHVSIDEAWDAVTDAARTVMGLPAAGPVPGRRAELLAVRADSLADAVAFAPAERIVFSRGRVVARIDTTRWMAPRAQEEAR